MKKGLLVTVAVLSGLFFSACSNYVDTVKIQPRLEGDGTFEEYYNNLLVEPKWSQGKAGNTILVEVSGILKKSAINTEYFNKLVEMIIDESPDIKQFMKDKDKCALKYTSTLQIYRSDFTAKTSFPMIKNKECEQKFIAIIKDIVDNMTLTAQLTKKGNRFIQGNVLITVPGRNAKVVVQAPDWLENTVKASDASEPEKKETTELEAKPNATTEEESKATEVKE